MNAGPGEQVDARLAEILAGLDAEERETLLALRSIAEAEKSGDFIPAPVMLGPFAAFNLVCLLQLAWRAPGLSPYQRETCERIATPLQSLFGPPLDAALAKGWDPGHDVDSEGRKIGHELPRPPAAAGSGPARE